MKKILVVDGSQSVQDMISGALSEKYRVLRALSAPEAIDLYAVEKPDLVLCELALEKTTGLELQRSLSERHENLAPFLLMSDGAQEDSECVCLDAGAIDYIAKPFRPEVLLRRVDNAMRQIEGLRQLRGLRVAAETDPMTGLFNKSFVQKTLSAFCPKATGALMMFDLDNFKLVNDLYGHSAGDRLLIRFAEILRRVVRSTDVVGRMGGDEFIVFCHDIRDERLVLEKVQTVNDELLSAAREVMGPDMNIPVGASVGAVFVLGDGRDFAELYREADKALYSVKQGSKRGCAFFREQAERSAPEARPECSDPLSSARAILCERGLRNGAYELGFENFRCIYRFVVRGMENYRYDAEFAIFSLGADVPEATADEFGALLCQSLRRSDVYTKHGSHQYLVIFPQPIPDHGDVAIRRVLGKWEQMGKNVPVVCEHKPILIED